MQLLKEAMINQNIDYIDITENRLKERLREIQETSGGDRDMLVGDESANFYLSLTLQKDEQQDRIAIK